MLQHVPLGVLAKSEQRGEDMVDILQHIHQYVPRLASGEHYPTFFDGDQVTRERASGAQDTKLQADEEAQNLKGVIAQAADWHTLVTFYQVITLCAYICIYSSSVHAFATLHVHA